MNKEQAQQVIDSPLMWGTVYTKRQAIKVLMERDIEDDTFRVVKLSDNKYVIGYTC